MTAAGAAGVAAGAMWRRWYRPRRMRWHRALRLAPSGTRRRSRRSGRRRTSVLALALRLRRGHRRRRSGWLWRRSSRGRGSLVARAPLAPHPSGTRWQWAGGQACTQGGQSVQVRGAARRQAPGAPGSPASLPAGPSVQGSVPACSALSSSACALQAGKVGAADPAGRRLCPCRLRLPLPPLCDPLSLQARCLASGDPSTRLSPPRRRRDSTCSSEASTRMSGPRPRRWVRRRERLQRQQQRPSSRKGRLLTLVHSSSRCRLQEAATRPCLQARRRCMAAGPAAGGPRQAGLPQMARMTALAGLARWKVKSMWWRRRSRAAAMAAVLQGQRGQQRRRQQGPPASTFRTPRRRANSGRASPRRLPAAKAGSLASSAAPGRVRLARHPSPRSVQPAQGKKQRSRRGMHSRGRGGRRTSPPVPRSSARPGTPPQPQLQRLRHATCARPCSGWRGSAPHSRPTRPGPAQRSRRRRAGAPRWPGPRRCLGRRPRQMTLRPAACTSATPASAKWLASPALWR